MFVMEETLFLLSEDLEITGRLWSSLRLKGVHRRSLPFLTGTPSESQGRAGHCYPVWPSSGRACMGQRGALLPNPAQRPLEALL